MSTVDQRQRLSILFLTLVYVVGYLAGRSARELRAMRDGRG